MKARRIVLFIVIIVFSFGFRNYFIKQFEQLLYPQRYQKLVFSASEIYKVDPPIIFSMIRAESGFYPYAKSRKNAKGLMQLSENTWSHACKQLKLENEKIYDKESNIRAGTWYFSGLLDEFQDEKLAILAYNAGPTNVREWQRQGLLEGSDFETWKIPYRESELYLMKVLQYKNKYLEIYSIDEGKK